MNAVMQMLKHTACGLHNVPKVLLGWGRLTDKAMSKTVLAGKVEYPETVDVDACLGCGLCSRICPMKCITMKPLPGKIKLREGQYKDKYPEINHGQCMFCFQCHDNCPVYTVHHRAAAIHPRGIKRMGVTAEELFRILDENAKKAGEAVEDGGTGDA